MRKKPSELDFEEYIRQVEPAKREKSYVWSTAIGLQQVDGLTPSDYLLEVAKKNIEGKISLNKAQELIDSYYESKTERTDDQDEKEEADKVSARIAQILSEKAFSFSPFFSSLSTSVFLSEFSNTPEKSASTIFPKKNGY